MASAILPGPTAAHLAFVSALLCGGPWGCRKATEENPRSFPENFIFGASMAGFQVDPGCPTLAAEDCEDRASDWYQWVTDEELIADSSTYLSGDPLSAGPGHWELYQEDFARAAEDLQLTGLRNSLEWSRLFPEEPQDATTVEDLAEWADPDAVQTYHDMFDAMEAVGIEPLVTLNHYTLPLWIHDGKACHEDIETCSPAGWADPERLIEQIALYSGWCALEFGDQVDDWLTLNEPFAVAMAGYLLPGEDRTNPPGVVQPDLAIQTIWAMVEAHGAMYDAVHAWDADARVGAAPNLAYPQPEDPDDSLDQLGAEHFDYVYNRTFLDGTVLGQLDRDLDGEAEEL
ncbi:MAG: family 1 glycosylhydrolase, partial [Myxococcota bacterium]|nr:family 1 glycosylhydrolase [Myxococcota bacterium]